MPTFWEIELNVPSLPEQQKIAEFLSTVDRVIEKQKETITTWKERKKGVMQKLEVSFHNWKKRILMILPHALQVQHRVQKSLNIGTMVQFNG